MLYSADRNSNRGTKGGGGEGLASPPEPTVIGVNVLDWSQGNVCRETKGTVIDLEVPHFATPRCIYERFSIWISS